MRILVLLLTLSTLSAHAQTYTVIHVIGKIYNDQNGDYLRSGSKLNEAANLKFETPNARAAVLSSSRGRYVLQKNTGQKASGDLIYSLSSVLTPARGKMSTRAGGINNQLDFAKKFAEGPIAVLNGVYKTSISPTAYPTDQSRFFYASYLFNGENINKKLDVEEGELVFKTASFYAVDGIPIDPSQTSETRLFYYDSNKEESTALTSLEFVIVSPEDIEVIKNSLGDMSEGEQVSAIQEIITALYGQPDLEQVQTAVQNLN